MRSPNEKLEEARIWGEDGEEGKRTEDVQKDKEIEET
jgi:hypothetical protein